MQSEIESLLEEHRQMVETVHGVGRFLWARYCGGYTYGRDRSRISSDDPLPSTDIIFESVNVLSDPSPPPSINWNLEDGLSDDAPSASTKER